MKKLTAQEKELLEIASKTTKDKQESKLVDSDIMNFVNHFNICEGDDEIPASVILKLYLKEWAPYHREKKKSPRAFYDEFKKIFGHLRKVRAANKVYMLNIAPFKSHMWWLEQEEERLEKNIGRVVGNQVGKGRKKKNEA
jgi:hypothetical protein